MPGPLIIIQDEPGKYHFKTKDDQRVKIEHKNRQIVLNLFKWGEEASLQIVLDTVPTPNHAFSENKIEVENPDFILRVYPIDASSTGDLYGDSDDVVQCHDGGLRFELVLKKRRPAMSNSFSFPLVAKNLRCAYQPFLIQEEIDRGDIRPLNVEGSYSFYHISKKGNQYLTGKMCHLLRPIAEDALGNKAWCSLYIDPQITELNITVPQQFLDEATYPITIDPDLGYTTIGLTWALIAFDIKGAKTCQRLGPAWTMPVGGTANWIKAYVKSDGTDIVDCKVFINQKDSGGAGTHGQIAGPVENLACAAAAHWEEFTLAGEVLGNGVTYIFNIDGDPDDVSADKAYQIAYDADGAVASYLEEQTYCSEESPWVVAVEGSTRDSSIYLNYSTGWTGKISGVTNPAEVAGVPVADIAEVKGVA